MRTAACVITLLCSLCSIACSRNYTSKHLQIVLNDTSQSVSGALVNRDFFTSSNARPYLGRFFDEGDFRAGRSAVVVVSYKAWQNMFRSRPETIGSSAQIGGRQTTIIGVAEPAFSVAGAGEFWLPKS